MKILHVINNLEPAGAEMLLSELAPALKLKGVDIEVATLYKYPVRTLHDKLTQRGVVVHSLDFSFRYDLRILGALKKLTDKGDYDIIHASLFPAFYWTVLARPSCSKMIFTEHSTVNRRMGNPLFKLTDRFVYGRYNSIVCVSNHVFKNLTRWLPSLAEKMIVIYNGLDLGQFKAAPAADRTAFGIPHGVPVCLMVARFDPAKDHKTVIEAALRIRNLHVLFAGQGSLEQVMKEYTRSLGMENRIHFLGYRRDILSLINLCDVYVQSSNWEGFGIALIEAMACGVPVVASNIDALGEIVQDRVSGLLFNCGDSSDLVEKITTALSDAPLNAQLRAGARARALDFSLDKAVSNLLSLYSA